MCSEASPTPKAYGDEIICLNNQTQALKSTADEMASSNKWSMANFGQEASVLPFSFKYGGHSAADLLKTWDIERTSQKLDERRTQQTLIYTDSKTGLEVRCVVVEYKDFPTVEWTVYFKNTGAADTPIIKNIQALDLHLERCSTGEFLLHHHVGSPTSPQDYRPLETVLGPKTSRRITTSGGRPVNSDFPYFNIEWQGEGIIIVIGWQGQWVAEFVRDGDRKLQVRAGQEVTHFKLHPGEEVRSPMIIMQFWKGDYIRSQNIWRRWMMAHNMPKPEGKLPGPILSAGPCWVSTYGINTAEQQMLFIERYQEEQVKLAYWWVDAGWYVCDNYWPKTGTWEVDKKRFPHGLREVFDYAHSKKIKTILWFQPEVVAPGTWLYENHPEWLLTPPPNPGGQAYEATSRLLNLGNPAALQWLIDHVDRLLTQEGVDLYREDFNMDALYFWRANDSDDRQGITENHHVIGHLAYWDELRRRHPKMLIDTCASGGKRNDIKSLRRALPLWRSDHTFDDAVGNQCITYGISFWLPFYGTTFYTIDPYIARSCMSPGLVLDFDLRRRELNFPLLWQLVNQWREFSPNFFGDYYPLTSYSLENDVWMAWQFNRPEIGKGMAQAFRRANSPYESACFKLRGLAPDAHYKLTNLDDQSFKEMTGRELMEKGLTIVIKDQPGTAIITYEREGDW